MRIKSDTAILAKKLGFDELSKARFRLIDNEIMLQEHFNNKNSDNLDNSFSAPKQITLQTWLRKAKKVSVIVKHYTSGKFSFSILKFKGNGGWEEWIITSSFMEKSFYEYEDAMEYGLFKALTQLDDETKI